MNGIIDIHSIIGLGRPYESRPVDQALREMDSAGVAASWICPSAAYAAVLNREGNEFIAEIAGGSNGRFIGCAVANPWFGDDGVIELRRAFEDGIRVLYLHPPLQGFQISDPIIHPLVETAIVYGAPIYVHTGTPICSEPFQLAALANRFPEGKFIMGHMGYADFWYDATPAAEIADNIMLETSLIDGDIILNAVQTLGAKRILFGSDAPRSDVSVEVGKVRSLPIPGDDLEHILQLNAKELVS